MVKLSVPRATYRIDDDDEGANAIHYHRVLVRPCNDGVIRWRKHINQSFIWDHLHKSIFLSVVQVVKSIYSAFTVLRSMNWTESPNKDAISNYTHTTSTYWNSWVTGEAATQQQTRLEWSIVIEENLLIFHKFGVHTLFTLSLSVINGWYSYTQKMKPDFVYFQFQLMRTSVCWRVFLPHFLTAFEWKVSKIFWFLWTQINIWSTL